MGRGVIWVEKRLSQWFICFLRYLQNPQTCSPIFDGRTIDRISRRRCLPLHSPFPSTSRTEVLQLLQRHRAHQRAKVSNLKANVPKSLTVFQSKIFFPAYGLAFWSRLAQRLLLNQDDRVRSDLHRSDLDSSRFASKTLGFCQPKLIIREKKYFQWKLENLL